MNSPSATTKGMLTQHWHKSTVNTKPSPALSPTVHPPNIFFFFHWHYSPLWDLACRTMSFHFSYLPPTLSIFSLPVLEDLFLLPLSMGLPLLLVPSSSWVKIFLGILTFSILSRWPNQLILCPFIHFTIFSPLLISTSSRFFRIFHSPFSFYDHIFL